MQTWPKNMLHAPAKSAAWCHTRFGLLLRRRVHRQLLFQRSGNHSECRDRHPGCGHHAALPIAPADCWWARYAGQGIRFSLLISTFLGILIIRVAATFFVQVLGLGILGAWLAVMLDQLIRWFLIAMRFQSGKWKRMKFGLTSLKFDRNKQAHLCMPTNLISYLSASF